MKSIILTVFALLISSLVFCQTYHINGTWLPYSDGSVYLNGNKDLGVGDIIFRTSGTNFYRSHMVIKGTSGKIGIGTENPIGLLDIDGGWSNLSKVSIFPSEVRIYCPTGGANTTFPWGIGVAGVTGNLEFRSGSPNIAGSETLSSKVVFTPSGNVGIGTTTPGSFKLAVEGKIGAREINVTTVNPWPDYVFQPTHILKPLLEVETYIKANQHLPEIPSAAEVKTNGINLGEMDALLLKKIEELTLYMIDINRKMEAIQKENEGLKKKIETLNK